MSTDWSSYSRIFDSYKNINGPYVFQEPARTLISMLSVSGFERLLDVGTGTGIVLREVHAQEAEPSLVGVDSSWAMLKAADLHSGVRLVAGRVPCLPFPNNCFDVVTLSFVLNHVRDQEEALVDVLRVLRPGGRIGMTAWATGSSETEAGKLWQKVADGYIVRDRVTEGVARQLSGKKALSKAGGLHNALSLAGFEGIETHEIRYQVRMPVNDYLEFKATVMSARCMKHLLDAETWDRFQQEVSCALRAAFHPGVAFEHAANFALGFKAQTRESSS